MFSPIVMDCWRHDICHVTASRWCHICQNVSSIPSNRYTEAIFPVGIIKKVIGEKRQGGGGTHPPPSSPRVKAIWENFEKKSLNGHATVVEVTRPSADCQTTFFGRFKQLEKNLKKVAGRSRDSGRRSRDRRPTVKQRFSTFQAIWENFEKSRWTVTRQWLRSRERRPTVKQRFLDVSSN